MSDDFATFVEQERARLTEARENLLAERRSIDARMDRLNNEFAAIAAYEQAKTGRASKETVAPRARRGSRRESIMNALAQSPAGLTRGELLTLHGVKGDKHGEMSVSNALTALTKSGQLVRDAGRYHSRAAVTETINALEAGVAALREAAE
jgi:hypothetical protein